MMTKAEGLITKSKGISTRYIQGYLDLNLLRKQVKYRYKRNDMPEKILEIVIDTELFRNELILATPISLKEEYYEYRYGIFAK